MNRKLVIGVMGPGESATENDKYLAEEIGKYIVRNGWHLLSGGRKSGVMGDLSSAGTLSEVSFALIGEKPFDNELVTDKPVYLFGESAIIDALSTAYKNAHKATNFAVLMNEIQAFEFARKQEKGEIKK